MKELLVKAIEEDNFDEVERILVENPECIDGLYHGITLPNLAAKLGREKILKYIVEYSRASFNETDEENKTILHYAVLSENKSMIQYLVERVGMSPVSADINLVTPFDLAYQHGYKEIISYFEEYCGAKYEDMYHNPILTGMHPDPSIICVGDDFYMVHSSFIYFPCIPISHSKDLLHWKVIGYAITNPEWAGLDELEGGRGYWAPDISYDGERFFITATYRLNDTGTIYRKQMVVSSERPEGPYSKPVFIMEDGIDPSIFIDDDGKKYMILNRGARIFEISHDGKEQLSKAELLYYGHQKRAPEGSHILKKDGWYYLFQAEGGTGLGHRISVSRSRELMGIYEPCPYNPIMKQKNPKAAIQRCGHGKPVRTPNGEWYIVYLCGRQLERNYSILGRETALDPITWTADEWPIINRLNGPSALQKKPNLPACVFDCRSEDGRFGTELDKEWSFVRVPEKDAVRIEHGCLRLKGSREPLSSMYARNVLVRKQQHFSFHATTALCVQSLEVGQHMGMTCYYDENTYLTFSLDMQSGTELQLQLTEHIGLETKIAASQPFSELMSIEPTAQSKSMTMPKRRGFDMGQETIHLMIKTDGLIRQFYYSFDGDDFIHFHTLENVYYLCDEGIRMGKRFTGAMIGLYAYAGTEKDCTAEYRYFKYEF